MPITVNTNVPSLNAQRRLGENTASLSSSFQRLSSGLRINRASDDAAGLAIGSTLNADARVYGQGIRNLNDGLSVINIAQAAGQQLSGITTRLLELAHQSANGTLGAVQRVALDQEAQTLRSEFSRIISITNMNGLNLLDGSQGTLSVQAGYGQNGSIAIGTGEAIITSFTGLGTLGTPSVGMTTPNPSALTFADVDNDGNGDFISNGNSGFTHVTRGNGDGTFLAPFVIGGGGETWDYIAQDFNNDGKLDIVSSRLSPGEFQISLGNGNGTFLAPTNWDALTLPEFLSYGDFNHDGRLDVAAGDQTLNVLGIAFGNGNGTFSAMVSYTVHDLNGLTRALAFADVNGDGISDAVLSVGGSQKIDVLLGNANGSFKAVVSYVAVGSNGLALGDLNGDGIVDVANSNSSGGVSVLIGNGNGTFRAEVNYATGAGMGNIRLGDFNSDGVSDIASVSATRAMILIGNGNGTFRASTSFLTGGNNRGLLVGDLNGDGVDDIAAANYAPGGGVQVLLTDAAETAGLAAFSLRTVSGARSAMDMLRDALDSITRNIGAFGASESRLSTALQTLSVTRENFLSASSRILDVDVAEESSELTRRTILQQASAAVLAQANQQPTLALNLLQRI